MTKQQIGNEISNAAARAEELESYIRRNNGSTLGLVQYRMRLYAKWAAEWRQVERNGWKDYYAA